MPNCGLRLVAWIVAAIAPGAGPDAGTLVVEPSEIRLVGRGDRQQVSASIRGEDGTTRDVSTTARLVVEPPSVADVSGAGLVAGLADGRARLVVEAAGLSTTVPIRVERSGEARPIRYRSEVAPILSKAGCNSGACHGNLNGKGGFRLSLRGEDPGFDLSQMTRESLGRRVDLADPGSSLLLRKPSGRSPHEGGFRFAEGSPEAEAIRRWIESGAVDDAESPRVDRIEVSPGVDRVDPATRSRQMVVTAIFADGSRRDVTRLASFDVSDPTKAAVSPSGRVEAVGPAEVAIAVRYGGARGVSRLAFLADRADFAWAAPAESNAIDEAVFAKLKSIRVRPSAVAPDAAFLRRAHLDAVGVLPTADEARAFLTDADPAKRARLVEALLDRPEFADHWALKWADLLRNEEKTMGSKGVWVFQRWMRDQIAADLPMDEFARRVVSGLGSTFANPPSSFLRTNREPTAAAEAVAQVFLGVRLQCAKCHNHPFDRWTQDDYYGLAAYFANLGRKQIANQRADMLDSHEINGDEVVYRKGPATLRQPRSRAMLGPRPLGGEPRPVAAGREPLDDLGDWLTRDNPSFDRNLVNRVWFHLMGRGIVDPVDDFRESNPPSNPELLDLLVRRYRAGGRRLRPLVAFIMASTTYGLSAATDPTNADDESNFSHARVRLLPAETLLDAISRALAAPDRFRDAPRGARAAELPGVASGGAFLKAFGKPDRLLTCECERSDSTTLAQAFQLINGESVRRKLEAKENRIGRLLAASRPDPEILDELCLSILGRPPAEAERAASLALVARATDRRRAWEDVAWALVNSKEFLLRH